VDNSWANHHDGADLPISRRTALAAGAVGLALPFTGLANLQPGSAASSSAPAVGAPRPTARNVIFFVVDGMSMGTLAMADHYRRYRDGKPLEWLRLASRTGVYRGLQDTHSADGIVTDSAAASGAWSTGIKHLNGQLSVDPTGRTLEPLLIRARRAGKRVGAVTTTTITHATPAGFYANHTNRDQQAQIGAQLIARPIDLALGGGSTYAPPDKAKAAGLRTLTDRAALRSADAADQARTLGVFHSSNIPLVIDRTETDVTLAEMVDFALRSMQPSAGSEGFLLQIEAGRVDHAAHDNDAGAILREMLEADAVLGLLAEWTAARPDTLLIATTDHGTANPAPTWYGKDGSLGLRRLAEAKHSFDWVEDEFKRLSLPKDPAAQADALLKLLEEAAGFKLTAADGELLNRFFAGQRVQAFLTNNTPLSIMGGLLASHTGVAFLSPNHTSDHTEVLALGAGADRLPPILDNTDLHRFVVESLGLPAAVTG
jgi:alkaline phosphatase